MATETVTAEGAAAVVADRQASYKPSWVDWIVDALDRLPGPVWLPYLGLTLASLAYLIGETIVRADGLATLQANPTYVGYLFFFVFPLAAYHYLAYGARAAWDSFRPATDLEMDAADRLRIELSTTPYRAVVGIWIVTFLATAAVYVAYPESNDLANQTPLYVLLRLIGEGLWVGPVAITLAYLVLRQLRLVARLHREVRHVDLLRPGPLHAMSRLTARAAFVLVVLAVFSSLPLPGVTEALWIGTVVFWSIPMLVLAGVAFFAPLRGMSRRLALERTRLLSENAERIESASGALNRLVDEETADERDPESARLAQTRIDALNKALSSLLAQREFVRRQSTWPWDASTLRAVVSAIALPIVLFVLTRLLDQWIF